MNILIIIYIILYKYFVRTYFVKINIIKNQSAVVQDNSELSSATQRLNAGNLYVLNNKIDSINDFEAYFVGLIEGDGCISVTKKGKYLTYELSLEMHMRDIQLLYKIKKILGVGVIAKRSKRNIACYIIRDKKHLKEIILPIFDKYPMLTKKEQTYQWFRKNLLANVIYSEDLKKEFQAPIKYNMNTPEESKKTMERIAVILSQKYFESWLIGFIEAEGCFSIYNSISIKDKVISFSISQTGSFEIIEAIRIFLSISSNVYTNSQGSSEIKTESKRGIENVVKFLGQNRVKLLGYKRLQFLLFLKEIRVTQRYSEIKTPVNY